MVIIDRTRCGLSCETGAVLFYPYLTQISLLYRLSGKNKGAMIMQNAKLTTKELAEAVHLSASPTFERQKRLEREGYIKKYVAVVDPDMVGNGMLVLCNIRLKQHGKEYAREFVDAVKQMEEVTECFNTSGDFDFWIKVFVRNMHHYQDFVLNRLGEMESIGSVHSVFVIGTVKNVHAVPVAP